MKRRIFALLLLASVLLCVGCGQSEEITGNPSVKEYTIKLASNPTTGFGWRYLPSGSGAVTEVSHVYTGDSTDEVTTGDGGVDTWVFTGTKPGKVTLSFSYTQGGEEVADSVDFQLVVREDLSIEEAGIAWGDGSFG